jgi:NAD(P)-dependent dehydrogenase (short-subunit alcohol dehydrogenase family)
MSGYFADLAGRHVLITGGANGIGAAVARAFAGQGCPITVIDWDRPAGEAVLKDCREYGVQTWLHVVDLTDEDALCAAIAQIRADQPPVDILIANAGDDPRFPVLDMSQDEWNSLFQLNVTHYFLVCRELLPDMIARRSGNVILTASHTARIGKPELIAYNSTKAAIIGFMRGLAEAVGQFTIRVNAVAPGWTMTERQLREHVTAEQINRTVHELQTLPVTITADAVAQLYLFLASDAAGLLTRQVLFADAGQSKH